MAPKQIKIYSHVQIVAKTYLPEYFPENMFQHAFMVDDG